MNLSRFKASEINRERLVRAVRRRLSEIPHGWAWRRTEGLSAANIERLAAFENRHEGQRCFVLGNGPSLRKTDLSKLAGEITFGTNRIYLLENERGFLPSYFVCINELVLEQYHLEIDALPIPKFLNWNRRDLFTSAGWDRFFLRLKLGIRDTFTPNPLRPVCSGGTVTYIALQLAYYMGFQEVILVGVDHSYRSAGTPNLPERREAATDSDHFAPDYFPRGSTWQTPDLLRSELAYQMAKEAFEADGRAIVDATSGGKLQVFPKADFQAISR